VPLSTILLLDFGTVPIVWYFVVLFCVCVFCFDFIKRKFNHCRYSELNLLLYDTSFQPSYFTGYTHKYCRL